MERRVRHKVLAFNSPECKVRCRSPECVQCRRFDPVGGKGGRIRMRECVSKVRCRNDLRCGPTCREVSLQYFKIVMHRCRDGRVMPMLN